MLTYCYLVSRCMSLIKRYPSFFFLLTWLDISIAKDCVRFFFSFSCLKFPRFCNWLCSRMESGSMVIGIGKLHILRSS